MLKSLLLLGIVVGLSYLAAATSENTHDDGRMHWNFFAIALLIFLILLCGLRTYYNDTISYIRGFIYADSFKEFLADPDNLDIFNNPAFYGLNSWVRGFTNNPTVFLMLLSIIVNTLNIRFFMKHVESKNFVLSMTVYTCMGFFFLTLAAQKQVLAMSILTLAIDQLIDKHYVRYYIIVYIAGLFHTYAWLYFILPFFATKPWSFRTMLLLLVTLFAIRSFGATISSVLEVADSVGKELYEYDIVQNYGMNRMRVAVYSVLPVLSLIYRSKVNEDIDREMSIFIQMSIIALMLILFGAVDGANMFGRAAQYFNYGVICAMPYVIRKVFNRQTASYVILISMVCFSLFFTRDASTFASEYQRKTLPQFITELIHPTPVNEYY